MANVKSSENSVVWCALACLGLGCSSGDPVNVGDGQIATNKSELASYAGSWTGYVELYTFPSGTERVSAVLDSDGDGHFQIGDADEEPLPTDPDIGYPDALRKAVNADPANAPSASDLWDGIVYPISGARVESERIRFAFDPLAVPGFKKWCELQKTTYVSGWSGDGTTPIYHCAPASVDSDTLQCTLSGKPIDCSKIVLCDACSCTETGCTLAPGSASVAVDAVLSADGHELTGTISLHGGQRTIRLKR